ncbi:protein unc-13 homolog [Phragmites australis]|uniref:protein unc-13 homolog n=1 Tax=Phragmites australis TaxID=29695 RepID=UPI002D77D6BF|nr:protein unc-13 homolog [Phragmites australis]
MARLFRESRRELASSSSNGFLPPAAAASPASSSLPLPFPDLGVLLSAADLREAAYEVLVAASRTTGGKPLTYIPQASSASPASSTSSATSSSLQRSLTSAAASKMKKALGLRSSASSKGVGSPGSGGGKAAPPRRPATVGELMRVQMCVSEPADARIRRGLLRIAASQLGRRAESIVLPLEFLQQFKATDFPDPQEYEAWRSRNLKLLEAGLLVHPLVPLNKSDVSAQRLRQIIRGAYDRPLETGKNSESMQVIRSSVMSLAGRSHDGTSDGCHWADGFPLNLHLYQMLVEACFDNDDGTVVDEIDEVMELLKKTWLILGINEMLHNLCFTWALFNHFVMSGQVDIELLSAVENQLSEVANDAKTTKDPNYCKVLSSTLSSIMGWTEKRLLAYHETFNTSNIESMQGIVSIGVSAAKVLVEDISHEYRRRRKEETDVARSRVETYIRSSLRTAFAQRMEEADSKRSSRNPTPVLSILAKDIGDLAIKEKKLYSPILKRWHPLASGVAVATLHSCYGNELKQFVAGLTELTPDTVQVLKAADKLEKDLVNIAVEDSVDSDDGGKSLIREMPPYEAENVIANLVKVWIKERVDRLKGWVDRNLKQETWNPGANRENFAPSSVEMLRVIGETLDAFFELPIPMHPALLPDLTAGLDRSLQLYVSKAKSGCVTRNSFMPQLPPLTRCEVGSKLLFKKKEKPQNLQVRVSQNGAPNGNDPLGLPQLCVRLNTLQYIRGELENLEKKIKTCLRNVESAQADITDGLDIKFELCQAACQEGIQQICETTAYKVTFYDLGHVLWDTLYVSDLASNRVEVLLRELDSILETISGTVHNKLRNRAITALMKATFDGFLLVLLAGGPLRAFTRQDSQIIEDDFRALRDLYLADGDGLPEELVDKASSQVKNVLPLLRADSESLIERFKRMMVESNRSASKNRLPLPPTTGHWSPNEPNTVLRVLCYRNDETATKFLKKTYNLPKKI